MLMRYGAKERKRVFILIFLLLIEEKDARTALCSLTVNKILYFRKLFRGFLSS